MLSFDTLTYIVRKIIILTFYNLSPYSMIVQEENLGLSFLNMTVERTCF